MRENMKNHGLDYLWREIVKIRREFLEDQLGEMEDACKSKSEGGFEVEEGKGVMNGFFMMEGHLQY